MRSYFPAQHQFGESAGIVPGQGLAANRQMVLNDRPPGFGHAANAVPGQRLEERTLS
jgi:hypothetical protein